MKSVFATMKTARNYLPNGRAPSLGRGMLTPSAVNSSTAIQMWLVFPQKGLVEKLTFVDHRRNFLDCLDS